MLPFPELRSLVTELRDEFASSAEAELRDEPTGMPDGKEQERLYALVYKHQGRVRQQTLIEETGWDGSKVSRRLQAMEENRCVARVETGREKIVVLPDQLPERSNVE